MDTTMVIEHSLVIAAAQERVWRALTTAEHFSKWFEGDISFKLGVGEPMFFEVGGESGPGKIIAVDPIERFAFEWEAETGYKVNTLVTFRLEAVKDGTRVTVTEAGFEALPADKAKARFEMNDGGWKIQMQNIAKYINENNI